MVFPILSPFLCGYNANIKPATAHMQFVVYHMLHCMGLFEPAEVDAGIPQDNKENSAIFQFSRGSTKDFRSNSHFSFCTQHPSHSFSIDSESHRIFL